VYISSGYLVNNTIVNNDVGKDPEYGRGGNVYAFFGDYSDYAVANNVIIGATSGGGLFHSGAHDDLIRFNNVWDNLPANYGMQDPRTSAIIYEERADWTGRFGNISENPLFRNLPMNDFHLQPESPCVSAGDPNSLPGLGAGDIDGDPRVFAMRVDIGADEHVGYVKPLADAGPDQHVLAPEPITLAGTGSYFSDPDGTRTYQWRQIQGMAVELSDATGESPAFTPPVEGWYVFELTVGDGQYASKPDRMLVVVGNEAPIANAGPDKLWSVLDVITLDGSRSTDADPPDTLTYTWKQIEGPPLALASEGLRNRPQPTLGFRCEEPGIYVFELVVSDGFTTSAPDTVKFETTSFSVDSNDLTLPEPEMEYHYTPAISGSKIAFAREDSQTGSWTIGCTDLETGREDTLQSQMTSAMPEMDGDLVVWVAGSGRYYQPMCTGIVAGDLAAGKVYTLRASSSTDSYGYPAISGRKAVWLHHRGVNTSNTQQYVDTPYDICGADLTDPARPVHFTIAEQAGHGTPYPYDNYYRNYEEPIDICGNLVVWQADGDIYGADISDLEHIKVFPICTDPEDQRDPSISGHTVVWTDQRNDMGDIYGADISDPNNIREFEVYVGSGPQAQPDIDGTLVAFIYGSTSQGEIMLCGLSREYGPIELMELPEWYLWYYSSGYRWYYGGGPKVDGSTVVWSYSDQVQGLTLHFGYDLTEGPVQNLTTGAHYDYVQHAIDTAAAGDTLVVAPGIYREKVRLNGKNVTLTSTNPDDPAVRAATVIAGGGYQVTFADDETADCVFAGFTVSGGSYGLFCAGAAPTIENCTITDNSYAGVKVWNKGAPTFNRCEIAGNATGVEMWAHRESRIVFSNYGTFRNCLVVGNREGGFYSGYPTLENCTVADNLGIGVYATQANVTNSIIYFNGENADGVNLKVERVQSLATYSNVQGGWDGEGNLDADPLFIARGQWDVPNATGIWTAGDYHLKSQGWSWDAVQGIWAWDDATSPCIDAGDPAAPLGDEPPCAPGDPLSERAGVNTRINMGAYGGTAEASLAPHGPAPQP